jgi:hypothetical protein
MTDNELRLQVALALGWHIVDEAAMVGLRNQSGLAAYEKIPNYANDIAAAWEMVDYVQAEPHEQAFELNRTVAITQRWSCHIGNFHAYGRTPAEAICHAFLAWHAATRATVTPCPTCGGAMRQSGGAWTCGKCNE